MAVDGFLLIASIVVGLLLIAVSIYLLMLYCHPDDTGFGASLFCKFLVVAGLTLAWAQVLMLPLDVANSRGYGGGFDMENFWLWVYALVCIFVTILLPFSMFFYESDEDKTMCQRFIWAIGMEIGALVIIAIILFLSWNWFRYADLPLVVHNKSITFAEDPAAPVVNTATERKEETLEISISFVVYLMAVMSLVGWFLFVIFGGVGLSALPLDLIHEYNTRPIIRDRSLLAQKQVEIMRRIKSLIQDGEKIENDKGDAQVEPSWWSRRKAKNKVKKGVSKFKKEYLDIEREFELLRMEKDYSSVNPLIFVGKAILGGILCIVSFVWYIHIWVYVLIRKDGLPLGLFLNNLFLGLEEANMGFIGTAFFAGFSLYLLWCTMKGNIKFGLKFLLISIHPMKINETWMNSFLFNVLLILLTSVSVTQFCSNAFSQYTRLTAINLIFGSQVQYMRFFSFFYKNNIFEWVLVIWSIIVLTYLLFRKDERTSLASRVEMRLRDNN